MKPIHRKIKQLQIRVVNRLLSQAVNYRGQHQKSKNYYNSKTIVEIREYHPFDYGLSIYRATIECKVKKDNFKHQLFWTYKNRHTDRIDVHTLHDWYGNYYDWKLHCFYFLMTSKEPKKIRSTDQLTTDDPDTYDENCADVLIIDEDRYGGSYSGYKFTVWINKIPDGISADDVTCCEYWSTNTTLFGGGETPDDACLDLINKLTKIADESLDLDSVDKICCTPKFIYYSGEYIDNEYSEIGHFIMTDKDDNFKTLFPKTSNEIFKRSSEYNGIYYNLVLK